MRVGEATCDNCGRATHLDYLDAKPVMTNWLRVVHVEIAVDFTGLDAALDELRKPVDEVRE